MRRTPRIKAGVVKGQPVTGADATPEREAVWASVTDLIENDTMFPDITGAMLVGFLATWALRNNAMPDSVHSEFDRVYQKLSDEEAQRVRI